MDRIPDRQDALNAFARAFLMDPEPEPNGNGHHPNGSADASALDDEVLRKLFAEKNGDKWSVVYTHGAADYYPSNSEAVAALLRKLAFYTGNDPVQIDRLIRKSALYREKFDTRRGVETWISAEIERAIADTPETYSPRAWESSPDDSIYSHHIDGEFDENKSPLPIKTVEDVLSEAGEEIPWVTENLLARGALTEFSGAAKFSGKTTFWCHAIVAGAKGEEHAGFAATPAKYLYLTEQGNNFALPLQDSGLSEYPDYIRIVQFKDVSSLQWAHLIRQAGAEAHRRGLDVLVVDTFAVFARLKGTEENDAGPVANRMRVLRTVAQKYNIAVLLIRHAGKDGTPRGSSAFEAEADICVTLSRPEGRHAPSVRRIAGIGRYGEWERNIQLEDGRYISVGSGSKIEFNKAVRFIKAVLPHSPEDGVKKQELLDKRTGEDEAISAATLDRALAWLVKQGDVGERQMMNQRGRPKVYWLAYKPPEEDGSIYSDQTPSPNDENKSNPPDEGLVEEF